MRDIRVHGQPERYVHTRIGVGGRMDTLQCAVVLAKLERFEWEIERRIALARRYDRLLGPAAGALTPVKVRPDRTSVFAQYTLLAPARERLEAGLRARGVPTAVHYPIPLHLQACFAKLGHRAGSLPATEQAAREVLSLPIYAEMTRQEQDRVIAAVAEFCGAATGRISQAA